MSRLLYSFRDIYCAIKTIDEVCKYSYFSQTSLFAQQKPNVLFGIFTGLIKFQHICTYRVHKLLITKSHISTHEVVMWDFFVIHCASDKTRAFLEILCPAIRPSGWLWRIPALCSISRPSQRLHLYLSCIRPHLFALWRS